MPQRYIESLYPSGEFDRWSAKGERRSLVDSEVQVGGLNPLGRCEREVLVHVDKRQGKYAGACGRVQQDRFNGSP